MDLYDVMRTTGAVRRFSDDPLPDEVLERILDNARFAPSGGNRQGARVIVVRDRKTREAIVELSVTGARRYLAQTKNGEGPWNPVQPMKVSAEEVAATEVPPYLGAPVLTAGAVLVVCVDLNVCAAFDQYLDRIGVIPGASVYPFVWNILLAARTRATAACSPRWRWRRSRASRNCCTSPTTTRSPRCCRSANRSSRSRRSRASPFPSSPPRSGSTARRCSGLLLGGLGRRLHLLLVRPHLLQRSGVDDVGDRQM